MTMAAQTVAVAHANSVRARASPTYSRDVYLGGGASFWLGLKRFPDFVAGLDFNEFSSEGPSSNSFYRDWDVKLSLDFSKYIRTDEKDRRNYLKLSHHIQGISHAEGSEKRQGDVNHALVLSYATPLGGD